MYTLLFYRKWNRLSVQLTIYSVLGSFFKYFKSKVSVVFCMPQIDGVLSLILINFV